MAEAAKRTGTVKWFNTQKGYGFITVDDGSEEIFVHQTAIHAQGFRSLQEGEAVEFSVEVAEDGRPKATSVTGPVGAYVQGAARRYGYKKAEGAEGAEGGAEGGGGGRGRGRGRGRKPKGDGAAATDSAPAAAASLPAAVEAS